MYHRLRGCRDPPTFRFASHRARGRVAVAVADLEPGAHTSIDGALLDITEPIPRGHKVALRDIAAGETVRKLGWPIGRTTRDIARGSHVHTHNLATALSGLNEYVYSPHSAGLKPMNTIVPDLCSFISANASRAPSAVNGGSHLIIQQSSRAILTHEAHRLIAAGATWTAARLSAAPGRGRHAADGTCRNDRPRRLSGR